MAHDVPGPVDDTDGGRIPRGVALPRLGADDIPAVRPAGVTAPDASPVLVLADDLDASGDHAEADVARPVPRPDRPRRGPVVGGAVAVAGVVAALALIVPGLLNDDDATQASPDGGSSAVIPQDPSPTPSEPEPTAEKSKDPEKGTAKGAKDAEKAPVKHATAAPTSAAPAAGTDPDPAEGSGDPGSTKTTTSTSSTTTEAAAPTWGTTIVRAGSELRHDQYWETNRIKFGLTGDGKLILIDENDTQVWSAGISGGDQVGFQGDGNLVVYSNGTVLWSSNTMERPGAVLNLQSDGNVTITLDGSTLWAAR
ncbi:hypothetical protein [Kineosporia succinea]|uniref:Bulb-type lectin domain-containing protein n=1 Tax=Kineosporia succinea TaxID=84632 RepID=A0ABT9PDT4_9ACTN|nr:hypothetical protein [Kineosporia succinea]MDP9830869.1 hypothetical protein [Kineosporia succinea]